MAASRGAGIVISNARTVSSATITVPMTFIKGGSLATSGTVTLSGPFEAGPISLFTGTVRFAPGNISKILPQWYGLTEGTGKSAAVRLANATALQAAITAAQLAGVCVELTSGSFEYSGTLLADDDFCIRGPGSSIRTERSWLIYTGTGNGIQSVDNTRRTWRWHIFNVNLKATNTANTGHGIFMETVNAPVIENVYILGFGGYGLYIRSDTGLGGVDSGKISKVHIIYCANGIYANGVTGSMVVDYVFDSCIVQELRNPDETSSNGYGFYSGQYTARNRYIGCTYKQSGSLVLTDAVFDDGMYNIWIGLAGEVNQEINEIHTGPNASLLTFSACFLQSRTRVTDEGENTIWRMAQRPITHHPLDVYNYEVLRFSATNVTNPTSTLVPMILASSGTTTLTQATSSYQVLPGSIIATVISRQKGTAVYSGYFRAWPTLNGTELGAGFYANFYAASEPTAAVTTAAKNVRTFVAGDKIGCGYKASFGGGGTDATFLCEVWITRDSTEIPTAGP